MASPKIRAEYDTLQHLAMLFSQETGEIETALYNTRRLVEQLEYGGWVGGSASAFYDEMYTLVLPALERLVQALNTSEHATLQIASIFQLAEEDAAHSCQCDDEINIIRGIENYFDAVQNNTAAFWQALGNMVASSPILQSIFSDKTLSLLGHWISTEGTEFLINNKFIKDVFSDELSSVLGAPFSILEDVVAGDFNLADSVGEAIVGIGLDILLARVGIGEITLINDVHQFFAGVVEGGSLEFRNLITGGNENLIGYQTLTDSIKEFSDAIADSDLNNILDLVTNIGNDTLFKPYVNSVNTFLNDMSLENGANMVLRLTQPPTVALLSEWINHPEEAMETLGDVIELGGHTLDFVLTVPQLPSVYAEHLGNMVIGTSEVLIEQLPLPSSVEEELFKVADKMYDYVDRYTNVISHGGILEEVTDRVDFSDEAEKFAKDLWPFK